MKKILIGAAIVAASGLAFAGLDTYTGKNFITVLSPVLVAANTSAVTTTAATATSNPIRGLPGQAAVLASYQCTGGGATAVLTFQFYSCVSTNTLDKELTALGFAVTNSAGWKVQAFTPNTATGAYLRCVVTPSGAVTNAHVCAGLISE